MTETVEFSRPFAVDRLGGVELRQDVAATAEECAALARRMAIPSIESLHCRFRLRRSEAGRVLAEAELAARLVRDCVVTLDPFTVDVRDPFRVQFVPAGSETLDDDPEADDEIPYQGGLIDLGEAAAEQLALTLDPYPHKPGAVLPDIADDVAESPFAALAKRPRGD